MGNLLLSIYFFSVKKRKNIINYLQFKRPLSVRKCLDEQFSGEKTITDSVQKARQGEIPSLDPY